MGHPMLVIIQSEKEKEMKDLYFIGVDLKGLNIFSSATKKKANQFAKENGWPLKHVKQAANRFWVIGQMIDAKTMRYLQKDGNWIDLPYKGVW